MLNRLTALVAAAVIVCGGLAFFTWNSGLESNSGRSSESEPRPEVAVPETAPPPGTKPAPETSTLVVKKGAPTPSSGGNDSTRHGSRARRTKPEPELKLTDAIVERFIVTAKALRKNGLALRPRARSGSYITTLSKENFSPKRFGAVHSRVTYALQAIEYDEQKPPDGVIREREAQLESMGRLVSAEAVRRMKQGLRSRRKPFYYDRVSDHDKRVVRKHRKALETVLRRPRRDTRVARPQAAAQGEKELYYPSPNTYRGAPRRNDPSEYYAPGQDPLGRRPRRPIDYSPQTNYGSQARGGSETFGGGSQSP